MHDESVPDEREPYRSAARNSVLQDLARDVNSLTGLVGDLHSELEELTEQNKSRWRTNIVAFAIILVLITVIGYGLVQVREIQAQLERQQESIEQEVRLRAEDTCQAVLRSRDVVRGILVVLTTREPFDIPPDTPPALAEALRESRERSEQRVDEAMQILDSVTCDPGPNSDPQE